MLTELRDGVWWLECTGVNAYLVADDDGLTLVDAGTRFDAAKIEACVVTAGFEVDDLERVLVTHYDVDHVGGASLLSGSPPVYVGRDDLALATGEARPSPTNLKGLTQLATRPITPALPAGDVRPVDDRDEIGGFTAYHAPGHTPGHTVYVHEGSEAAFLGDAVVEWNGDLRPAPWFLTRDTDENRRSIRTLAERLPPFEAAAMGHGTPFAAGGGDQFRRLADRL